MCYLRGPHPFPKISLSEQGEKQQMLPSALLISCFLYRACKPPAQVSLTSFHVFLLLVQPQIQLIWQKSIHLLSLLPGLPHDMVLGSHGNSANIFSSQCLVSKKMSCRAQLSAFSIYEALRSSPNMDTGGISKIFNGGKSRATFLISVKYHCYFNATSMQM